MSLGPVILLPPSQGKRAGSRAGGRDEFAAALREPRGVVRAAARATSADLSEWARVIGARGPLLARYGGGVADGPTAPAWWRYDGVVWRHLDPATLDDAARGRILVPSALYGVTTSRDAIVDYRLTFSGSLDGVGRLDAFWRPLLAETVSAWCGRRTVVDLLALEQRRALDLTSSDVSVLIVEFLAPDGRRAAGHAAKAVKGVVARSLVTDGLTGIEDFRWRGWRARRSSDGVEIRAPRAG